MLELFSTKISSLLPKIWLWLIVFVWGVFFSRAWLGQVHAKWLEVRRYAGSSYAEQLAGVYSNEMPLLQEKVSKLSRGDGVFLLVVPEKPRLYPIANNPPLLRALTAGRFEVVSILEVSLDERGVVFWHPDQFFGGRVYPVQVEPVSLEVELAEGGRL